MKLSSVSSVLLSLCAVSQIAFVSHGFAKEGEGAWFGLPLPGPATDAEIVEGPDDLPQLRSPYAGSVAEFDGKEAHRHLVNIVNFSYEARDNGDPFWGRMTGSPSYNKTIDYIEKQFRAIGAPVERREVPFYGADRLPTHFHANVLLRDEKGREVARLPLQSAFPLRYRPQTGADGKVVLGERRMSATAELVPIGRGDLADIATRDLRGKIAIATIPSEPTPAYSDYRRLPEMVAKAGAAGLILAWSTPGNMQIALANCMDMPCINLGGRDGAFVRALIARAAVSNKYKIAMDIGVNTETRDDKTTSILTVKIPGQDSSNNIVLSAHADAYLAGANDNASGVAILNSLLKYYKNHKPKYDIYFSVSPGHHSNTQGINPFLSAYPDVPKGNILGVNIEHVAQRGISRSQYSIIDPKAKKNYDEDALVYVYSNVESSLREVQLSHDNDKIKNIVKDAITRHRMVVPARIVQSTYQTEIGPVADAGGITLQPVEVSLVYHTSGDTEKTVSPETLEDQALFYKDLIDQFSKYKKQDLLK